MNDLRQFYERHYAYDATFQQVYTKRRVRLYRKLADIASELGVRSLLDIGCSFGLLMELCNERGIDAWGVDLPIAELQQFHLELSHSHGKFYYGSVTDLVDCWDPTQFEMVCLVNTLIHIPEAERLSRLRPRYWLIKEVSANPYIRYRRRRLPDVRLYAPNELLQMFSGYHIERLYPTRFIACLRRPSRAMCKVVNALFPSYTVLLQEDSL